MLRIFFLLLLFTCNTCFSQIKVADSLVIVIQKTKEENLLIPLYAELGTIYITNKPILAEPILRKGLALANKLNMKNEVANYYRLLGFIKEKNGKYDDAELLIDSCTKNIQNDMRGQVIEAEKELLWGSVNRRKAKYEVAMGHFMNAEKLAEKFGDKKLLYSSKTYLGICNVSIKNYEKAMEYHNAAISIALQMNDYKRISKSNSNIGIIYREKEAYEEAYPYFEKALENALLSQDSSSITLAYDEAGNVCSHINKLELARTYLNNSMAIRLRNNELSDLPYTYFYLASLEAREKNLKAGQKWVKKAMDLATQLGSNKQILDSYNSYHYLYMSFNMFDSALANYKIYKQLDAEANNNIVKEKIAELNIQYETSKKEKQIQQQKLTIVKKNGLIALVLGSGIIALIVAVNYNKRQKLKQQLTLQKEIFKQQEEKSKAIFSAEETERKRISRDLHDNMGAYTSALISNVAQLKNENGTTELSNKMDANAQQILASLRETIWVLNNKEVTVQQWADSFNNYCFNLFKNFEHISFTTQNNITNNVTFTASTGLHLSKILQEAVQNSIKHSKAMQVNFTISSTDKIRITLTDNGIGFDKANLHTQGNGLENMEYRASEIGFQYQLTSSSQNGTQIVLESN
jgi:signal transduction histidine kinase